MWQYQNTDELYHANMYKNMNKKLESELYHSDIYLGKDYSDGIKHWKYIKREKINGRWRYYYKDDKLDSTKKEMDKAYDDYNSYFDKNKHKDLSGMAKMAKQDKAFSTYANKKSSYDSLKNKSDKRKAKYDKYLINPMNKASDAVYNAKQKVNKGKEKIKQRIGLAINKIKSRKTKGKA